MTLNKSQLINNAKNDHMYTISVTNEEGELEEKVMTPDPSMASHTWDRFLIEYGSRIWDDYFITLENERKYIRTASLTASTKYKKEVIKNEVERNGGRIVGSC